eukprot:jgi/Orpsp1_1/1183563/evm.model.c7180000085731.1
MNLIKSYLFNIIYYLLQIIIIVNGISEDCKKLNRFLNQPENENCCNIARSTNCEKDDFIIEYL